MFSKEFGTKTGANVNDKYQIQLKKVFAAAKISASMTNLPKEGNS